MRPRLRVGFGIDNERVGNGAICNPKLVAVEHVSAVALVCAQFHGHDVAACTGL